MFIFQSARFWLVYDTQMESFFFPDICLWLVVVQCITLCNLGIFHLTFFGTVWFGRG